MKSGYQLDKEMMIAWSRWMKAQEVADRAKAEYEKAARAMKKHIEEHIEEMMNRAWKFIEDAGITEDEEAYKADPNLVLVDDIYEVRDAYCEDLESGINIEGEDLYEFLDRHGIDWK